VLEQVADQVIYLEQPFIAQTAQQNP